MQEATDKNTSYMYVGCIDHQTVHSYLTNLAALVRETLQDTADYGFVLNLPQNSEGEKQTYCYVWWDDAKVLDCILSKYRVGTCDFEGHAYTLTIGRCEAKVPSNPRLDLCSLTSTKPLPDWITTEHLEEIFARYNKSNYFSCRVYKKGNARYGTIRFDRCSQDATFALIMHRIVLIADGDDSHLAFFYYSQKQMKNK